MKTKKQEELIGAFLSTLDGATLPVFQELIDCLVELGYYPRRGKASIAFKHDAHNKQIAKIKTIKGSARFALRFSACSAYSRRFADIIAEWMAKYPTRTARCPSGGCHFCAGEPNTHVYARSVDGERKAHCGAYALEIPNLAADDIEETLALIRQEHAYLMKHEAVNAN